VDLFNENQRYCQYQYTKGNKKGLICGRNEKSKIDKDGIIKFPLHTIDFLKKSHGKRINLHNEFYEKSQIIMQLEELNLIKDLRKTVRKLKN